MLTYADVCRFQKGSCSHTGSHDGLTPTANPWWTVDLGRPYVLLSYLPLAAFLLLYCCFAAALLLLCCCFTDALLLLYCCFTAALLLLYWRFTGALLVIFTAGAPPYPHLQSGRLLLGSPPRLPTHSQQLLRYTFSHHALLCVGRASHAYYEFALRHKRTPRKHARLCQRMSRLMLCFL